MLAMIRTRIAFFILLTSTLAAVGCASGEKAAEKSASEATEAAPVASAQQKSKAAGKGTTGAGAIECIMGSDKRMLEVVSTGSGCELKYTKFGETKTIAQSQYGTEHCEKVSERVQGNLAGAGFTCG